MSHPGRTAAVAAVLLAALGSILLRAGAEGAEREDVLRGEVARWAAFLRGNASTDEFWTRLKGEVEPGLVRTETALAAGQRWLALQRLARVQPSLAAAAYLAESRRRGAGADVAALEAEWGRVGTTLRDELAPLQAQAMAEVGPAAVRGVAEAALPHIRTFYEASLEYGRNTMPDYGLFYLGSALAERDFVAFCRRLSSPGAAPAPALRSLRTEIDDLEGELLRAYRPPASLDQHREFIVASSLVKEARELDDAGLRHGALLVYLQAALRMAPLRPPPTITRDETGERLRALAARLGSAKEDHSLGAMFREAAEASLASTEPGATPADAIAVATDVLPRYFAALEPAPARPPPPRPQVTVTLVRWPYT